MQANQWFLLARMSADTNRVPDVRRLLSPVSVGVSAARHVLWYLSYHAAPRQR
jgi:hypothetical protein